MRTLLDNKADKTSLEWVEGPDVIKYSAVDLQDVPSIAMAVEQMSNDIYGLHVR